MACIIFCFPGSCRSASCVFQQWGPWEGALPSEIYCESACGCEKRTRGYTVTWSYVSKVGRCGPELQPQCPPPDIEKRKRGKKGIFHNPLFFFYCRIFRRKIAKINRQKRVAYLLKFYNKLKKF